MYRLSLLVILTGAILIAPCVALAQADAQEAFDAGRAAFDEQNFAAARDLFARAAELDANSASAFLWLGKAHYQLGDVDQAIAAWTRTLELAPDESYSAAMLEALRGQRVEADTAIRLIETLVDQNMFGVAIEQCESLLADNALTDAQRAKVLILQAESLLSTPQWRQAVVILEEVQLRYGELADPAETRLLLARAKLKSDFEEDIAEGVALLEQVAADYADTQAGRSAQLELLLFRREQDRTVDNANALKAWVEANGEHSQVLRALWSLLGAQLELSHEVAPPRPDTSLNELDLAAIATAKQIYARSGRAAHMNKVTGFMMEHLVGYYRHRSAHGAAIVACRSLLEVRLNSDNRQAFLTALADVQRERAVIALTEMAASGELTGEEMPEVLVEALAAAERLNNEFPELGLRHKFALAGAVQSVSGRVQITGAITQFKLPDAWALEMMTDVLRQDPVTEVDGRVQVAWGIIAGYAAHGELPTFALAADAAEQLLTAPLTPTSRRFVMGGVADIRREWAVKVLRDMARADELTSYDMPQQLVDALAAAEAVYEEFPSSRQHYKWVLGWAVHTISGGIALPPKVTEFKPTDAWAMQMLMDVLRADQTTDMDVRVQAVWGIIAQYAMIDQLSARELALKAATELHELVPPRQGTWSRLAWRRIDLLDTCALMQFRENIDEGRREANAELTDKQVQLIETILAIVAENHAEAERLLARLDQHLAPWVQHGYYDVARDAYSRVTWSLPLRQQQRAALMTVRLSVQEVQREFQRRLLAGMSIPTALHPKLEGALRQCYGLQAGLEDDDPFLAQVRAVSDGIVNIYVSLEMFDLAEQALYVTPDRGVPAADTYRQFRLAALHDLLARRELAELLQQYDAGGDVPLTPAFVEALAEHTRFIIEHPDDPLMSRAVQAIFNTALLFQQHKAYDVTVAIYRDFIAAAGDAARLTQSDPDSFSVVQQAQMAAANTLLEKARNALNEAMADLPTPEPPEEISEEFTAAIAAYKELIQAYPDTAVVAPALQQVLAVALEYVRVDAWDVADGVYADLLASDLDLRAPEQINLFRGLCQLGKAMPDHARQMLNALSTRPVSGRFTRWGRDSTVSLDGYGLAFRYSDRNDDGANEDLSPADRSGLRRRFAADIERTETAAAQPLASAARRPTLEVAPPAGDMDQHSYSLGSRVAEADELAMVAIRRQHQQQASRIAQMREPQLQSARMYYSNASGEILPPPILSEAEIARQHEAIQAAYEIFQAIRAEHPQTAAAQHARSEVILMANHWRGIAQWRRAAELSEKYLADNPTDAELPQLRLVIAMDYIAWAQQPVDRELSRHEMLTEVADRFTNARRRLSEIVETFEDERPIVHQAQWQIAQSFLSQANVVEAFSPILARGQYVRAARELQAIATEYHDHPNIASVPDMMWGISEQLAAKGHFQDAVTVWDLLRIHYPTHRLAGAAALRVAQTYQFSLMRPLMAAEAYLELNASRGGNDVPVQDQVFQIGSALRNEKRWVEALHVLETFADTFPRHPSAGLALTMVGQIHQTNEAWEDAIVAYRRVIDEYDNGDWVRQAKWSIAECTINLSRWRQAIEAYRTYLASYPGDGMAAEASRRVGILKDLERYQALVDEDGQRKAFDAQYQIAEILATQLANPVKAIIEFRKVTQNWPDSHLADDALFRVGTTYRSVGEIDKARQALLAVAVNYPTSPWADDALFVIGQMYEDEAGALAAVTREQSVEQAQDIAQHAAYGVWSSGNREMLARQRLAINELRSAGDIEEAERLEARNAAVGLQSGIGRANVLAGMAARQTEELAASQLADRQDKINAALREAVASYQRAAQVPTADMADESLLRMAVIYADQLKDPELAMSTYYEIVRQFSGTAVAEDASWRIAEYHERQGEYEEAIGAYDAFLRNYRRSPKASDAQFAIAESYEQLGQWVQAMDAYTNYINNFPDGPMITKAREQINWIRTYRL